MFDPHRSALFSHDWKNGIVNSAPKSNIWFSNVAIHTKLFAIFAMQSQEGNNMKYNCIADYFRYPYCAAKWELPSKNANDHDNNWITEPGSKELTERHCLVNSEDAQPLVTIMTRCPNLPHRNNFIERNTHFHSNSWSAWISEFRCTGKKCRAIFDPANSGLSLPSSSLIVRGSECICEFFVFCQFSHKISQNAHLFVSSFPMWLQTCNNNFT